MIRVTVTMAVAVCLVGCGAQPGTPPAGTPTVAASSPPAATATAASVQEPLNPVQQIEVVATAEAFLRALALPDKSRNEWWAAVKPHLTEAASKTMKRLDPATVGFTRVTGSGQLQAAPDPAPPDQPRTVVVPTDTGPISVEVVNPTGRPLVNSYTTPGADAGTPASTSVTTPITSPSTSTDPNLSAADAAELKAFATTFMKAFAKPAAGVSAEKWWEKIASMLTDDAVDTYAGITPSVVPVRRVTGPVTIEPLQDPDSDGFWLRTVAVGTDAGDYKLIVQLPSSGFSDRLLVAEIQEP